MGNFKVQPPSSQSKTFDALKGNKALPPVSDQALPVAQDGFLGDLVSQTKTRRAALKDVRNDLKQDTRQTFTTGPDDSQTNPLRPGS